MKVFLISVILLASSLETEAASSAASLKVSANPIRKVVTMLQNMQKKITAEGKAMEATFDKYMCYCENADSTLGKSIADAETKIPQLEASIKEEIAAKKQLKADLKKHKADRTEAKEALAKATAIREKEAKAFAAVSSEAEANLGALAKAIPAIEKGMGSFLQVGVGSVLKQLVISRDMRSADRDLLAAFLENSQDSSYAPKSGEIVGILKTMEDEMSKDFADAKAEEATAISQFKELEAAKLAEVAALTKSIESKTTRLGDISVKIAETENDLEDTKQGLEEDKKFLADLDKNCEVKKAEWEEYKKMQAMEMVALADTIKVLNDDDALELFKKTLPGASSFMQVQVTNKMMQKRALSLLQAAHKHDPRLDIVLLALRGKKMGFDKIIKMIDDLIVTLKTEQTNDDEKKSYCLAEFDKYEDKAKELKLDISDLEKAIADGKETIETATSEIAALTEGIKSLDKSVAEATETRKQEHDEYVETLAANSAAKDILAFAKNRLNKFYNPKLYKAPPKRELSEEERITVNMGGTLAPTAAPGGIAGTGISAAQTNVAPPPPPEANIAYKKSGEESNGVIAMIDLLVADIDKENQIMKVDEEDAQKDYEKLIADSAEKRALDSKAITDKESAKAEAEDSVETSTETKKSKTIELMETDKMLAGLHQDCDWLLSNFVARKEARTGEIDALGKAKDVLSGADYSFVQTKRTVHLRGVRRA